MRFICDDLQDKSDTGVRKLLESGELPLERILVESDAPFMYPNTRASKLPQHVKSGITERSQQFLHRLETIFFFQKSQSELISHSYLWIFIDIVHFNETNHVACQPLLK